MSYEKLRLLSNKGFKRYLGVDKELFEERVNVIRPKARLGKSPKLSYEEQLCIALIILRIQNLKPFRGGLWFIRAQ